MGRDPMSQGKLTALPWVAGIMDAAGFALLRRREGRAYGTVVGASVGEEVALHLLDLHGGRYRHNWYVSAVDQEDFLKRIIPYLRTKHMYSNANKVLLYRLTVSPTRRGLSDEIKSVRRKLAAGLDPSRQTC